MLPEFLSANTIFTCFIILKLWGAIMKKIVGYTTGVYDLFHIGHLNVLRRARKHCDYLIVGVTTDELCKEEKNKYPVVPFDERIEIVKGIRYVDKAVPQTSMDKMAAWQKLKFDLMFVGDDWKGTERWNELEKQFAEVGATIVYLPYTRQTSSTKLRIALNI